MAMTKSLSFSLFCVFVAVVLVCFVALGHCADKSTWHDLTPPKQHFWQKHPTRTKVLTAIGVGSMGLVIALAQRHNCAKFYDGKAYDGTPPCPK